MQRAERDAQAYHGLPISDVNPPTHVALRGGIGLVVVERHAGDLGDHRAGANFDLRTFVISPSQKTGDYLKTGRSVDRPQAADSSERTSQGKLAHSRRQLGKADTSAIDFLYSSTEEEQIVDTAECKHAGIESCAKDNFPVAYREHGCVQTGFDFRRGEPLESTDRAGEKDWGLWS